MAQHREIWGPCFRYFLRQRSACRSPKRFSKSNIYDFAHDPFQWQVLFYRAGFADFIDLGGAVEVENLTQSIAALSGNAVIQRLSQFFLDWRHHDKTLLYIVIALAVGFVVGRYRGYRGFRASEFQNRGEALVSRVVQANFKPPDYHLMNHLTLPMTDGTTQVDHILISRFGVFVIETKHYKGWIFANAMQKNWTQVVFKFKYKFQNPIFQNVRHVRAVQDLLDFLPADAVKSVVVFAGEAKFMTDVPEGVFSVSGLIGYLRNQTVEVMSLNRVQFCVGRIETARLAISGQTDVEHVQNLERRHGRAD